VNRFLLLLALAVTTWCGAAVAQIAAPWPKTYGPPINVTSSYFVLTPSGGDDTAAIQAATTNNRNVWLQPTLSNNAFDVRSQITVPSEHVIAGPGNFVNPGSGVADISFATVAVHCTTACTFPTQPNGQPAGFFAMQDHSVLKDFAIYGNRVGGGTESCITAFNVVAPEVSHMMLTNCSHHGVDNFSDSAFPGPTGIYSQFMWLHDTAIYQPGGYCYRGDYANSGFVSDFIIRDNVMGLCTSGSIYVHSSFVTAHIDGNRMEDFYPGIVLNGVEDLSMTGNLCDKTTACISLTGVRNVSISGGRWHTWDSATHTGVPSANVEFSGTNTNVTIAGVDAEGGDLGVFKVAAGGSCVGCTIQAAPPAAATWYVDDYTRDILAPQSTPLTGGQTTSPFGLTLTSTTFSEPDLSGYTNIIVPLLASSCVSAGCTLPGPQQLGIGIGQKFRMTFVQDPTTGGSTINWGAQYLNPPTLSSVAETFDTVDATVLAGGNIQFGNSVTFTQPNPNGLTGGSGMTSGWTAAQATFTTGTGTNASGAASAATTLVEDSTVNALHRITQSNTLANGVRTISVYGAPLGAGSTRYVDLAVNGPLAGQYVEVAIASDGSLFRINVLSATLLAAGVQQSNLGWTRYYMTYKLNSDSTTNQTIGLYDPQQGNVQYNGDGVSGVRLWQPEDRAGTFPGGAAVNGPTPANPTGTVGASTATNGTSLFYARADSAPACAQASSSVPGCVKVDGSTITASAGVITAIGGAATDVAAGTTTVTGTCPSGQNLYNNGGVVGCQPNVGGAIVTKTAVSGVDSVLTFAGADFPAGSYNSLQLKCVGILPSAAGTGFVVEVETGGSTWQASSYSVAGLWAGGSASNSGAVGTSTATDLLGGSYALAGTTGYGSLDITIDYPAGTAAPKKTKWALDYTYNTDGFIYSYDAGSSWTGSNAALTGARLRSTTNTFGGVCSMYGSN
jgi:hypothetical protein